MGVSPQGWIGISLTRKKKKKERQKYVQFISDMVYQSDADDDEETDRQMDTHSRGVEIELLLHWFIFRDFYSIST